jgi:hypothetical protein
MNCQIIQIEKDFLKLQIISSKLDTVYSLLSVIQINRVDYLLSKDEQIDEKKSFGEVTEQSKDTITVRLFVPQKFLLSKIVQVTPIKSDSIFLPNILNSKIIYGEKTPINLEQVFEFIPTVQIGELVVQGQKIGYINVNTSSRQNFKHWILAEDSGKINKISVGDFKVGELVVTIGRNSQLLVNSKNQQLAGAVLLVTENQNKILTLTNKNQKNYDVLPLTINSGFSNLIIDQKKHFLNSINFASSQLENTVLIFVTTDDQFLIPADFNSIIFLDKYKLGNSMSGDINNLTLSICELGYNVIVVTQSKIDLTYGSFKTINGEDVSITIITQDTERKYNPDHFDRILKID